VTTFAGTLALLSRGGIPASSREAGDVDAIGVLLAACASFPLVAGRRFPLGAFAVTGIASALLAALGYTLGLALGPAVALYMVAARRDGAAAWTWRTTLTVLSVALAWLAGCAIGQGGIPDGELFHGGLAFAVGWFAGERARLRREQIAELRQRARRAEVQAEHERRLAVAEERARIARDLHDSAGHAINVIAVRAGAARLRPDADPARYRSALETIEEVARDTAGELDQILGTLRDGRPENGEVTAPPGIASLQTLIAHHTAAGLAVTLRTAGAPRPLTGTVDQAAYRIAQEALTNAARHGAGAASIELAFGAAGVELTVTNPLRADPVPRSNGGHGLIGMRERAALTGGRLQASPTNDSFRVRAELPYRGPRA
jgi:signal transduction histidine kinase